MTAHNRNVKGTISFSCFNFTRRQWWIAQRQDNRQKAIWKKNTCPSFAKWNYGLHIIYDKHKISQIESPIVAVLVGLAVVWEGSLDSCTDFQSLDCFPVIAVWDVVNQIKVGFNEQSLFLWRPNALINMLHT